MAETVCGKDGGWWRRSFEKSVSQCGKEIVVVVQIRQPQRVQQV